MTDTAAGRIARTLGDGGMTIARAEAVATRILALAGTLAPPSEAAPDGAPFAWWVPGRIEVFGKHTDYGGGRSLLCATERGICVVAAPRDDDVVRVRDTTSGETVTLDASGDRAAPGHWAAYPLTVARRATMNFGPPRAGADIVFASDLPMAAGLSSSSALVVAVFLALSEVNDYASRPAYRENIRTDEDLAAYLGAVENGLRFRDLAGTRGVGTAGGSEDHTAVLCARPGRLVQYAFAPVRLERVIALPADATFVIAASGVTAEKSGTALEQYNGVARRLALALERWCAATGRSDPTLGAALAAPDAAGRISALLRPAGGAADPDALLERFEQFRAETMEIIPLAGDALRRGDLAEFGALADRSQRGAERALGNQIPATIALAQSARALGAMAASAFGAGFGGSVWALVGEAAASEFVERWRTSYEGAFPELAERSEFFATRAGPAAMPLSTALRDPSSRRPGGR